MPWRSLVPHSHRKPSTSIELLIVRGTPCRGPVGLARHDLLLGSPRLPAGAAGLQVGDGVEHRVDLLDAGEMSFDDLDGTYVLITDAAGQLGGGLVKQLGHRVIASLASLVLVFPQLGRRAIGRRYQ